jgi:hypothetical protein
MPTLVTGVTGTVPGTNRVYGAQNEIEAALAVISLACTQFAVTFRGGWPGVLRTGPF